MQRIKWELLSKPKTISLVFESYFGIFFWLISKIETVIVSVIFVDIGNKKGIGFSAGNENYETNYIHESVALNEYLRLSLNH